MIYISRQVFTLKRRTKRFTGKRRQITGFGFALKTPTKRKIHLNPTK
jgi:hypothetical protein